jgi:hypothetical protein
MKEAGNKEGFVTLKNRLGKKRLKISEAKHCICNRRLEDKNPPPFSSLHRSTRNDFLELTHKYVTVGARDVASEWQLFVGKALTYGSKLNAKDTVEKVMGRKR